MSNVEVSEEEVQLILEALQDAMFYRDARAHVVKSVARRLDRRGGGPPRPDSGDEHRAKAQSYAALAARLKPFVQAPEG